MKNKIIVSVLLVIALAGGIIFETRNHKVAENNTTVRIAYLPLVHGLPLYLAAEKKYFESAGIHPELISFQSPSQIIDALLQGKVDITSPGGATGIVAIADSKNPGKLKIYSVAGGDTVVQNDALLVKKDSMIQSVQDLKGKKLGILTGSIQWQTIAKAFLAQNNLVVGKDVTIVELPINLQAQALASGQIDALIGIEPIPTVITEQGIGRVLVDHFTSKYISDPFYGGSGILNIDFANNNPELAAKTLAVFKKSIDEVNQNPNDARQYLKKYLTINDSVVATVPVTRFRMFDELNQADIDGTQKFLDIFNAFGVVNSKLDFKSLLYAPKVK